MAPPLLLALDLRGAAMPYVGKEYVQTYMRSHAGPFSIAEREEIERRRKKLNSGRTLSDEQLLQICDPGPTTEETEKMERRERGDSDDRTWTPLMWAAKEGHDPVVKELLAGGADISCTSKNGSTALSLAKKYGHEKCVELLERAKKSGMVGDKEYRGKGSARQAKPANSAHALFNTRDKDGKTPAHAASENGHADTLRVVIKGGCSIHVTDEVGCSPAPAPARARLTRARASMDQSRALGVVAAEPVVAVGCHAGRLLARALRGHERARRLSCRHR